MKNTENKESTQNTSSGDDMSYRKLTRSQSITTSTIPSNCILPPDVESQWRKRRESLDNLNVNKVAPWMHLHDFSESDALARRDSRTSNTQ